VRLRRLHPDVAEVSVAEALDRPGFGSRAPAQRPFVAANMVVSVDGRAAVHGRSGPLGSEADRALFHGLRARVDAVLVGTGTLRAERYGRLVRDPEARAARAAAGLAADPLVCVISRSLDVPVDIPLFQEPAQTVVVYTASGAPLPPCPAAIHLNAMGPGLTPAGALADLRRTHGVRSVLCEGGPRLLGALLADGLVDELFLTVSPLATGQPAEPRIVEGAGLPAGVALELCSVLEAEGSLFLRYAIAR